MDKKGITVQEYGDTVLVQFYVGKRTTDWVSYTGSQAELVKSVMETFGVTVERLIG